MFVMKNTTMLPLCYNVAWRYVGIETHPPHIQLDICYLMYEQ
jgi:hypothetical protein